MQWLWRKGLKASPSYIFVGVLIIGAFVYMATSPNSTVLILAVATTNGQQRIDNSIEMHNSPTTQTPLTCTPIPSICLQERIEGVQPSRVGLRDDIIQVSANDAGSSVLIYPMINNGIPSNPVVITPDKPIPPVLLRGLLWQESRWLQFGDTILDPDNVNACTLVSFDCGYGITQLTDCMRDGGGCPIPNLDLESVASDLHYNLSAGIYTLINKWNYVVPNVSNNNHVEPEQWYYAITAYNGWSWCNSPNRTINAINCPLGLQEPFDPNRPPYGEQTNPTLAYPYQEKVWGTLANPHSVLPGSFAQKLWRASSIAPVPRGVWGVSTSPSNWQPPDNTPKPVFHLLHGVRANLDGSSIITINNPTSEMLAADIALYNEDHTFNSWWLMPGQTFHRIEPGETLTLPLNQMFSPNEIFEGYARVISNDGLDTALINPPFTTHKVFLPILTKNTTSPVSCASSMSNGGFEQFRPNGAILSWTAEATDGYLATDGLTWVNAYPLVDGTWFKSGHYGAYLGGYNDATDTLIKSGIYVPTYYTGGIYLKFAWYVLTQETFSSDFDKLYVFVEDNNGRRELESLRITNQDAGYWGYASLNLRYHQIHPGDTFSLSFEADVDSINPTSFFIDDVSLEFCFQ